MRGFRRHAILVLLATTVLAAPLRAQEEDAAEDAVGDSAVAASNAAAVLEPYQGTRPELPAAHFPSRPRPAPNAPNVILVMTDDVGFGAASTFGGLIETPTLDRLASAGLRFNNFHTTAMCSPSRAALLTGRNAHVAGTGTLTDLATGFPGYVGEIPRETATVAQVLRQNGYATAFFGKHHNAPPSEASPGGPYDNWPQALGFDHFYGFVASQTDQWRPALVRGTSREDPPGDRHLDDLLISDAVRWVRNQKATRPDQPFFLYLAPAAAHAPLQAPREWVERYRGRFDQGWDRARENIFEHQRSLGIVPQDAVLTPRPSFVQSWASLSSTQRRIASRLMEVHAAQLSHQDHQFGILLDQLERMGQLENTLIIFIEGDNGASSEGGPNGTNNNGGRLVNQAPETEDWLLANLDEFGGPGSHAHYPMGWAWAMNTPFRYFKRYASHLGGIRNGMVIAWGNRIAEPGALRSAFSHLVDIAPTIYEAAGITPPDAVLGVPQRPLDGRSLIGTFNAGSDGNPPRTQYFEMLGNRAIYQDGWFAATTPPEAVLNTTVNSGRLLPPEAYDWELYNLGDDFSQSRNLAASDPQRLRNLQALWQREAERNQVLPLDNRLSSDRNSAEPRARLGIRRSYTYWGSGVELGRSVVAPILRNSFRMTAYVNVPDNGGSGVLAALGDRFAGWSFYLQDGRPTVTEAFSEQPRHAFRLQADERVRPGPVQISYIVHYPPASQAAEVAIRINDRTVASSRFPNRINMVEQGEPFAVGRDVGIPVTDDYSGDGAFNGEIERIVIDLVALPDQRPDP